ncbi:Organic cation transporter [Operophtera brumata]|uniref:Organic cation transporter n=1 Tax=Operophtera brumata TaxID=104452 RepID=A0A0L7KEY4_OPEBR|nr:Organic cation transporter [Operophtera brumata]
MQSYALTSAAGRVRCQVPECERNASSPGLAPGSWSPAWTEWALGAEPCARRRPLDGDCTPGSFDNESSVTCDSFVYGAGGSIVAEVICAGGGALRAAEAAGRGMRAWLLQQRVQRHVRQLCVRSGRQHRGRGNMR